MQGRSCAGQLDMLTGSVMPVLKALTGALSLGKLYNGKKPHI